MSSAKLSPVGEQLKQSLDTIAAYDRYYLSHENSEMLHVPNVANVVLIAYEQLRNASENIEDHLLLQQAILRYYRRTVPFIDKGSVKGFGKELIIELTQAQYLKNDSVPLSKVDAIDKLLSDCYNLYWKVTKKHSDIQKKTVEGWILELLSVKSEQILNSPIRLLSFVHLAHAHFTNLIDYDRVLTGMDPLTPEDKPTVLYISIHKALLKSNDANVRSSLFDLHALPLDDPKRFVDFNVQYDALADLPQTTKLSRFISKNGAPLRVVRSAFFNDTDIIAPNDLANEGRIISIVDDAIKQVYQQVRSSLDRGIIKSIIFLLITKALIGLLIEIPYDLFTTGAIVILPLVINLVFPPLVIMLTALTMKLPGQANTDAIASYIRTMVYVSPKQTTINLKYAETANRSSFFNAVYVLLFFGVFLLTAWILQLLEFNIVQGFIFVLFFSTASFLSYRLTLQVKELELVATDSGFLAILRNLLYVPFIYLGQKISYRFGKMNLMAQVLDAAVDLPLKTMIRLIRQWIAFLANKQDELL